MKNSAKTYDVSSLSIRTTESRLYKSEEKKIYTMKLALFFVFALCLAALIKANENEKCRQLALEKGMAEWELNHYDTFSYHPQQSSCEELCAARGDAFVVVEGGRSCCCARKLDRRGSW